MKHTGACGFCCPRAFILEERNNRFFYTKDGSPKFCPTRHCLHTHAPAHPPPARPGQFVMDTDTASTARRPARSLRVQGPWGAAPRYQPRRQRQGTNFLIESGAAPLCPAPRAPAALAWPRLIRRRSTHGVLARAFLLVCVLGGPCRSARPYQTGSSAALIGLQHRARMRPSRKSGDVD